MDARRIPGIRRAEAPKQAERLPFRTLRVTARLLVTSALVALASCAPKVQVEAPKDPIVINLNVKIEHEIRVKVDKDLEDLFESNDKLF